jgi:hypothetical protein
LEEKNPIKENGREIWHMECTPYHGEMDCGSLNWIQLVRGMDQQQSSCEYEKSASNSVCQSSPI